MTAPASTALYARVSKASDQSAETQLLELRAWAAKVGAPAEEFVDELSSRDRRPMKEELLRRARLGEVDTIAVVRLDRWGRSMDELVVELEEFARRKVAFVSLREGLRFDDAAGRLLAHVLAAFASFERDLIGERTRAGLDRARREQKILGRHPKGCGCGARPPGRAPHLGDVLPVRQDGRVVGWRGPDKGPPPGTPSAPREAREAGQTDVSPDPPARREV